MQRGAALIVNTQARAGQDLFAAAQEMLAGQGTPIEAARGLENPGLLADTIRELADAGHDPIIVGGGDGSLSTAATVLAGRRTTLGILPLGTANDFARTLGIPQELEGACTAIAHGVVTAVDTGVFGERRFLNLASVGLAGEVSKVVPHWLKRFFGPLAYPIGTAYAFLHHAPFNARLTFPDGDHPPVVLRRLLQIGIGNGRYYGGGMLIAPDAGGRDGLLDVYAIEWRRWRRLLPVARALKTGRHVDLPGVCYYRTSAVTVQTRPALEINVDGDLDGVTPQRFSVARRSLRVLVPEDSPIVDAAAAQRRRDDDRAKE